MSYGDEYVAIDTETELIKPGVLDPRLVCLSWADTGGSGLVSYKDTKDFLLDKLGQRKYLIGHNISFDLAVILRQFPELYKDIWNLYEENRVKDTQIREVLYLIRRGRLGFERGQQSLAFLAKKYLNKELDKSEDGWRLRYGELRDKNISAWPEDAYCYAVDDAESTFQVFFKQEDSPDEDLQVRAAWALHLMSVHGIRTDESPVRALEASLIDSIEKVRGDLAQTGFLREERPAKPKLTKVLKKRIQKAVKEGELEVARSMMQPVIEKRAAWRKVPVKYVKDQDAIRARIHQAIGTQGGYTATGKLRIDAQVMQRTGDPDLEKLIEYSEIEKLLTTYVPLLVQGIDNKINARFNVLVETGRTSCSRPNLQNQPRKEGVRECFIPSPGHVFVACDYDAAELRALAQICYTWFGESKMREAILLGRDLHLSLGATILGITYEEALERKEAGSKAIKEARQFAKIANFGFPGGLGVATFVEFARGYGHNITEQFATELRDAWFESWPEMRPYFARANVAKERGMVKQLFSNRIRGNVSFTKAANTMFQGLIADGAKCAVYEAARRCYTESDSPLWRSRPVAFVHDEIIMESPETAAADAAKELEKVMCEEMQKWLPDVPVTASAHLMRRWRKDAEECFDHMGNLIPWEDGNLDAAK